MAFNDSLFVFFILGFFLVYFPLELAGRSLALKFCASASFLFVAFFYPPLAVIPLGQTAVLLWFSRRRRSRSMLAGAVLAVLAPLLVFKYAGFVAGQFGSAPLDLPLPLGISFYTFTAIGFLVDHYRRPDAQAPADFWQTLNFLTFWPHLASGPILRTHTFLHQQVVPFGQRDWATAAVLIVFGLFKKAVIADGVGGYVSQNISLGIDGMSAAEAGLTLVGYGVRIYGDFSGYSDMALGFALLMGIRIPANFNYPFVAASLSEFWHRWHISLSTWFRDYLFVPLGGSRNGPWRMAAAIMVTFVISGFWHGAAWSFVIWAALHGAGICVEKMLARWISLPRAAGWLLTMTYLTLGWALFFLPIDQGFLLLERLIVWSATPTPYNTVPILVYAAAVALDAVLKPYRVVDGYPVASIPGRALAPAAVFVCMFFAGKPLPFIYFDF